jgi:hypothetical protein
MTVELPNEFQCLVKSPEGETKKVEFESEDNGETMKRKIFEQTGYCPSEMKLVYLDEEIEAEESFVQLTARGLRVISELKIELIYPITI